MIYQLLIISSTEGNSLDALSEQISYIEQFGIEISLLIDPDELEILKILDQHYYNGAYIHTPLYNFINDTLVSESTVLRHLLRHLILYWFRLFP